MHNEKEYNNPDNWLDEALKSEPGFHLSSDFAERVAKQAVRRFAWNQYFREFLIYLAAFLGIVVLSAGMSFIWLSANWKEWLQFVTDNFALVAGLNFLGVFILFADRVLLRYFFYKFSNQSVV
ncbi:MAG TPA: hypothetical protein VJ919_15150 [Tangfeifania sp.]|nr:hypothetical protein [Tangfeifania sp.]